MRDVLIGDEPVHLLAAKLAIFIFKLSHQRQADNSKKLGDTGFLVDLSKQSCAGWLARVDTSGDNVIKISAMGWVGRVIPKRQKMYLSVYLSGNNGKNFFFSCQKAVSKL